jgi:prefoldin subunit 5
MDAQTAVVVVGLIATAVPTGVGFLLKRAINGIDESVKELTKLTSDHRVEIAKLEGRIQALERHAFGENHGH